MVNRHRRLCIRLGAAFVVASGIVVLLSPSRAEAGEPTTTPEIIEMLRGEISEGIIARKIEVDGCECLVSPELIKGLQEAGASEELLQQLITISAASSRNPVTTPAIIEMLVGEISEQIIWQNIAAAGCECDTSAESLIGLKQAGATDELMAMLIEVSAAREQEPSAAEGEPVR